MFRRSRSNSSIPIATSGAKNLFSDRTSIPRPQRSTSVSRDSVTSSTVKYRKPSLERKRDSVTSSTGKYRKPSLERKPSFSKISRATPVLNRASTLSVPSSAGSSSRRTRSPGSAYREKRSVQKLAADTRWVEEQYQKIKEFIIENELFEHPIPNLKPPTIKQFIHVTETLLGELFPGLKLNNENYKEVITDMLKILQFPGSIPISTLKTVNVMRTWPQIVTLFAFLIDKVYLQRRDPFEDIPRCFTTPEENVDYMRFVYAEEHILTEYRIFNVDFNDADEQFVSDYNRKVADLMGVDTDKIEWLKEDIVEKKKLLESQNEELDKLSKEEKDISNGNRDIDDVALEIEKMIELDTAKTTEEFENITRAIEKLPNLIEELKENVSKLESEIEKQPCTVRDMEMLAEQIDILNNKIDIKSAKVKHARDIKEEYDSKLDEERMMLRDMVVKWNISLMKIAVRMPRVNQLLLPESGFHSQSYLEQLDSMLQLKDTIERELVADMSTARTQLEEQNRLKVDLETNIGRKEIEIKKKRQEIDTVTKEVKQLELEINLVKKQNSEVEDALQQKLGELSNSTNLKELKASHEAFEEKRNSLEKKRKKTTEKILAIFVEVYDTMSKKIEMMMKVGNELEDCVYAATEEASRRQERKSRICKGLKQIQDKLEQLHLNQSDMDSKSL